jgi:hypothetical protein
MITFKVKKAQWSIAQSVQRPFSNKSYDLGYVINAKMLDFFSKILNFYSTFLMLRKNSIFD